MGSPSARCAALRWLDKARGRLTRPILRATLTPPAAVGARGSLAASDSIWGGHRGKAWFGEFLPRRRGPDGRGHRWPGTPARGGCRGRYAVVLLLAHGAEGNQPSAHRGEPETHRPGDDRGRRRVVQDSGRLHVPRSVRR